MSQVVPTIPTFNDYGIEFQQQLIAEIITDQKFGNTIIEILEPKYFVDRAIFFIVKVIKTYYEKHGIVPAKYSDLIIQIKLSRPSSDTESEAILDTVEKIRESEFKNLNVQEETLNFCKLQSLKTALKSVDIKLKNGSTRDYPVIEEMLQKAFSVSDIEQPVGLFTGIEEALSEERRDTCPTGINGIDSLTDGGIAAGEVALIIAPLGVGKTTILTKIANSSYSAGKNVLHIVFEDKLEDVKRKHFCAITGIPLSELSDNRDEVIKQVREFQKNCTGNIEIIKYPASGVTVNKIKNLIKRQNSKGRKIDLVVLDYIDCIEIEYSQNEDEWGAEGKIMRKLETIAEDFKCGIWTATQGNRSAISSELVTADKMGGSIKKAQFAHLIIGIGKTLEQRELKTGTITVIKNRFGDDGKVYENCVFDNSRMMIDTEGTVTIGTYYDNKEKERQQKINDKYDKLVSQRQTNEINNNTGPVANVAGNPV